MSGEGSPMANVRNPNRALTRTVCATALEFKSVSNVDDSFVEVCPH
jgi:hypothetical protein